MMYLLFFLWVFDRWLGFCVWCCWVGCFIWMWRMWLLFFGLCEKKVVKLLVVLLGLLRWWVEVVWCGFNCFVFFVKCDWWICEEYLLSFVWLRKERLWFLYKLINICRLRWFIRLCWLLLMDLLELGKV